MRIFDLFKRKKKDIFIDKEVEIQKTELIPNTFNTVSKKQFQDKLVKYFDLKKYGFGISPDEKTHIFYGDINNTNEIDFEGHILIIGNLKTNWVNLTSSDFSWRDSGGSLFVTGNIQADYLSNDFNRFVMINGSLIIKKIINVEFEDSSLVVNGDLITEYYHGIDIPAEVQGKIEINYGWGYCNDKNSKTILPKNNIENSLKFLNVDKNCNSEQVNGIIKKRITNAQQRL
ncbi:hypothetical protein [Tenacibaculum finnmarkense]|uniref:hypothetical protein n=1 Tax=Tenacibaculum finnmarkense TaxID=2781243 RepID=UPI001E65BA54|nr:hypothetical protein [Tenacibaculum finnmarkense]MCD8423659.1 hypothetical protein [Tenacibaculum finnmarkense genomovar ulcerans]MCD8445739.1 hypothetical protein [Tenacibaculum finnmarkense genomovar ulcerans]MCG8239813.1 hypothetical protein [Tenacibaculum finnmarkense genomovar ulcerans]MCG8734747.1 hypothetical protein [Tenacibaculum finnmarkense]MCG8763501.1 hypothetical protein [Tenacibaculum finnmarkense]